MNNKKEAKNQDTIKSQAQGPEIKEEKKQESAEVQPSEKERQLLEQLVIIKADFENFRKRAIKEKESAIRFANERLIVELISLLDDFDRALENISEDNSNKQILTGVKMVQKNLQKFLKLRGLEQIEAVGKSFDPRLHEAVEEIKSTEHPDYLITDEMRKGYKLYNVVIRPSAVKVAKKIKEKDLRTDLNRKPQIEESI